MCTSFVSLPALFVAGSYLFFFGPCGRSACTAQVGKPPLCGHPRLPFAPLCLSAGYLGPPSVLEGPCAPSPTGARRPPGARVHEPVTDFLCFLPSESLLCLGFQGCAAPGGARLWRSFPGHGSCRFRAPSLPEAQAPAQKFSIFSVLCLPSLCYLRELSLSPWRPGVFRCLLEVAL